jgi:hypothetical protein
MRYFTKKYYSLLGKLSKNATDFIIATDYDIEGEVIGWNVARFIAKQKDARRMKFGAEPLAFISPSHPYGVLNKATHVYRLLWPIEPAIWTNDPLVNQTPGYVTSKPK